jgi:hypothetical protein
MSQPAATRMLHEIEDMFGCDLFERLRHDRDELGLRARLESEAVLTAEIQHLLDNLPLLIHLDRIDADVAAVVLMLGDGGAEGVVDVADAVLENVAKPDQDWKADASQHQVIGELLQVDGTRRILRRVHEHVAGGGNREVALPPALHLVEVGGIGDGKGISCLPVAVTSRDGTAHANMIHTFSPFACGI